MEDLKLFASLVDNEPEVVTMRKAVLSAEWRKDARSTDSGSTVDAWYGALGKEEVMYLERTTDVFGMVTARGVIAERADGKMDMTPLPDVFARYLLALVETKPENVHPFAGTPPIETPFWAPHFFLMERLPGIMDEYSWSGVHGEKGIQLVGHNKEAPENYLRIDHEPSNPLHQGTLAYIGRTAEGERLIAFPVTKRFVNTATETWKAQQSEESN